MELIRLLIRLPRLIQTAVAFVNGAQDLAKSGQIPVEGLSPDELDRLRACVRSILRTCVVSAILFGVLMPLGVPWIVWLTKGITIQDASERMLCSAILMYIPLIASIFFGASLGCLLAPGEFLKSPIGRKWLEVVGTHDLVVARVVSFLAVLSLGAFFAGYCWFFFTMHPTQH
jgi:hypothetical protein